MEKLAIIIPAHNEQQRIGPTVKAYLDFFKKHTAIKFEIIVVLNACTDHTREVVEQHACKELRIIEFERGGKGFAVVEGFKDALKRDFTHIGFVDADMATTPAAYYHLYQSIENADCVIASRYIKGSVIHPAPTFKRRFFSRVYNAAIRSMFLIPFRDTQCGAKIFTKKAIARIVPYISMSQWAFDIEILYTAEKKGLRILEVPTAWSDREYSKVNSYFKSGFMMFLGITRLRIINSPFRRFIRVYDFFSGLAHKATKKL